MPQSGKRLCLHLDGLNLGHSSLPASVGKVDCDAGVEAETSRKLGFIVLSIHTYLSFIYTQSTRDFTQIVNISKKAVLN